LGHEGTIGDEAEEASALDVLAEAGVAGAEDVALLEPRRQRIKPPGVERVLGLALAKYDQLPRLVYWHQRLVQQPTLGYLLALGVIPAAVLLALGAWLWGRTVLAFCLLPLGLGLLLLWRRSRAADAGTLFTTLLTVTGLTILAGTQVIFLKDFLAGGDWYRMNTIFKFFSQVWVMWGVAAAVAVPRIWQGWGKNVGRPPGMGRLFWGFCFALLLLMSLAYLIYGTPARLDMRMVGWRPPFGTLNGMEYMREGTYTWPDEQHRFELKYDREAIDWLLDHVRGNVVIVESDMVGYYREGGSRVATMTGLSGVRGMHESEQRYGEEVGQRDGLHHEFWATPDVGRTQQIMDELHVGLIYVGQLEQQQNPEGVQKIGQMAANGLLTKLFANERTVIYAVPGRLTQTADGLYLPQ
jgi:uncharacterized membrane protein